MKFFSKRVIIATHYLVYGASQALRDYLLAKKIQGLIFIAHPLQRNGTQSYFEYFIKGKAQSKERIKRRFTIPILNYFLEFYLTLYWILKTSEKFDLFIGVDCLNAFAGILLRRFKKVRKVVFYTIDYTPKRFGNNIVLNAIYYCLDRYCVKNVDEVWNVSPRIAQGRKENENLKQRYSNQKVVPIGVWLDRIKRKEFNEINKHQLLFIGHLLKKQGVQVVLDAIPKIIKEIPDFHFLIIGGGEWESRLRQQARKLNIENYVTFTGWIKERRKLDDMITDSALAIAMYDNSKDIFTYYADPTKLKDYLSAGLPIVLTNVPHNAKEIEKNGCGFIVEYDKDRVATMIIKLMKDVNKLKECRENAFRYIQQFDWNLIFKKSLSGVL